MPTWGHQLLLWGLPVIAIPVLIHLINMLRHRRVEWAAMEFLLLSQKKHRTWIILKQLLLLLMRMAAVAAVVLIVAKPTLHDSLGSLLGTDATHHIILLDDSFSMSDPGGEANAFAQAKGVIEAMGKTAARQQQPQTVTLLRLSRAGQYGGGTQPDFIKKVVDEEFPQWLEEKLQPVEVSQTSAEPSQALEAAAEWVKGQGERRIVYVISDFRARQWDEPAELRKRLQDLNEAGAEIRLVDCVEAAHPNLAITSLVPDEGVRAVKVPWDMAVEVQNFGATPAKNVNVNTSEGRCPPIPEIPPGGKMTQRFEVRFDKPGEHRVTAQLGADAVAADNSRHCVVNLPKEMPVLLVDSDAGARDAKVLARALAPGGPVLSGIQPKIEVPALLSRRPPDETRAMLAQFGAVALVNVDRLDESAVVALEDYVAGGGGVAVFVGERGAGFMTDRLYRNGKGMFPLPLAGPEELLADRLEKVQDIDADEHFLFRSFQDKRNAKLAYVRVFRYVSAPRNWKPPADSTTRVVARLRNNKPLIVEKKFGKGRVIAILTTAFADTDPDRAWNNWARESEAGTFPAVLRDLCAYLAQRGAADSSYTVGMPLQAKLPEGDYESQVQFTTLKDDLPVSTAVEAKIGADGQKTARLEQTDQSGFYAVQLTKKTGGNETHYYAVNVDAAEGDLNTVGEAELATGLADVKYKFEHARSFESENGNPGGSLSQAILYALLLLLIGEQILAWSCSYHPAPHGRGGKGGVFRPLLPLGEGRGEGRAEGNGNGRSTPRAAYSSTPPPDSPPAGEGTVLGREGGAR